MIVGIVGHESAKFTALTEQLARRAIRDIIKDAEEVVSGGCHLGGIDEWAIEEADALQIPRVIHFPKVRSWEGGYKQRNILIAEHADAVYSIVVAEYPEGYAGMRFPMCYHCGTRDHIKSGGCWTAKHARKLGKPGNVVIIKELP